jgi:hypothetical protein
MKYHYPKNVILDIKTPNSQYSNDYWALAYSSSFVKDNYYATSLNLISSSKTASSAAWQKSHMSTVVFNTPRPYYDTLKASPKPLTAKAKHLRSLKASSASDWTFTRYDVAEAISSSESSSKSSQRSSSPLRSRSLLPALFDINFIKKERLYTKLKYSRSPAYDIVSGGSAALLAGFIGFLVSEKFGIELVDSGDFYIVFMYAIFLALPCRLFLKMMSQSSSLWNIVSPNYLFYYLADMTRLMALSTAGLVQNIFSKGRMALASNGLEGRGSYFLAALLVLALTVL